MTTDMKAKGTWMHRLAIRFFTLVLAVLAFWILGFLVDDIRSIPGPDYGAIEAAHLDKDVLARRDTIEKQLAELGRQIDGQTQKQRVVGDSSRSLQQTIGQLIELQKVGMQKNVAVPEAAQANLSNSMRLFLENQKRYQELSQSMAEMLERKEALVREKESVAQQIEKQRQPARAEYARLSETHRLRLAFLQLAMLLPILVAAAVVIIKKRSSIYFPLFLAFGAAPLIKVGLVVHDYFPSKYFKYILIGVLLVVVARLLIHFIRTIAFPKTQWMAKQYREAYERFLCPVCEYPIRTGPRRFLFWTRRTVNKIVVPGNGGDQEEAYTCPACGSRLFEECVKCHKVRHAMLPNCPHCGAEKEIQ